MATHIVQMSYRGNDVWVLCDSSGAPSVNRGLVKLRYQPAGRKDYSGRASELEVASGEVRALPSGGGGAKGRRNSPIIGDASKVEDPSCIHVYTDGACSGNPGPSGLGYVIVDGDDVREEGLYLGQGTNNTAELTAIKAAIEQLPKPVDRPVVIHTDSQYSMGVLARGWKAKANQELIKETRAVLSRAPDLTWHWVKGHAGHRWNERCDALATQAVARRGPVR